MLEAVGVLILAVVISVVITGLLGKLIKSAVTHRWVSNPMGRSLLVTTMVLHFAFMGGIGAYLFLAVGSTAGNIAAGVWVFLLVGAFLQNDLGSDARHTVDLANRERS